MRTSSLLSTLVLLVFMRGAFADPTSPVLSVAFSPDSRILASGEQNGKITLYAVPALTPLRTLSGHQDGVTALAFSRDGRTLFSGSMDRKVRIWNVATGAEEAVLGPHSDDVLFIALSPDGRHLAVSSYDGATVLWDVASRRQLPVRMVGHTVDWSRDGRWISTASIDGAVHLYTAAGKAAATWKAHSLCPNVARFSPDGRWIATCVDHVKLWNVKTHKLAADLDPRIARFKLTSVVWSPNGQHLVTTSTFGSGARFDRVGGKWVLHPLASGAPAQGAAYSPDGRYIAICNFKAAIELLDAARGKVVARRVGRVNVNPVPLPGRRGKTR
jgi:WD40 repeat protein